MAKIPRHELPIRCVPRTAVCCRLVDHQRDVLRRENSRRGWDRRKGVRQRSAAAASYPSAPALPRTRVDCWQSTQKPSTRTSGHGVAEVPGADQSARLIGPGPIPHFVACKASSSAFATCLESRGNCCQCTLVSKRAQSFVSGAEGDLHRGPSACGMLEYSPLRGLNHWAL